MQPYDPSNQSLFHPEIAASRFEPGRAYAVDDAMLCEFSRLAYIRFDEGPDQRARLEGAVLRAGFAEVRTFSSGDEGTQGFLALAPAKRLAVVAFRGTQIDDFEDFLTNVDFVKTDWPESGGEVHEGFAEAMRAVRAPVEAALADWAGSYDELVLTGHSLGAALALLAATVWPQASVVSFGMPRVGNEEFVATLAGRSIRRYANCCDLVTRVPPELIGYAHVGEHRYIDREGVLRLGADEELIANDREAGADDYDQRYDNAAGVAPRRELADHAMANYLRALWPEG